MREDIWYRDQFTPAQADTYRVTLNDHGVWLVDRASYNPRAMLEWHAVSHDTPAAEAAVHGFKMMRKLLAEAAPDTSGYFLGEQLCQWAASLAAQKTSDLGTDPVPAAAIAVSKVKHLTQMPLIHALAHLQRAGLMLDTPNALQAQLLIHACKQADDASLIGAALDMRGRHGCNWIDVEALQSRPTVSQHLQLTSESLISVLRQQVEDSTNPVDGLLRNQVLHFEAGTAASAATLWLDNASNYPLDFSDANGAVRVLRDWSSLQLTAERYSEDSGWTPIEADHSQAKAATAAYNWAQDHTPSIFDESALQREGFLQMAANIASGLHDAPIHAANTGIMEAKKQATTLYACALTHANPMREQSEVIYHLQNVSAHKLTRAGIERMTDYLHGHPTARHQSLETLMRTDERELVLGVTIADPQLRLNLNCEPKLYMRIQEDQPASSANQPASSVRAELMQLSVEAGLGHYHFSATDSLNDATLQPNVFKVQLRTEIRSQDHIDSGCSEGDDHELFSPVEVYEATELQRIFRDKGLSHTPSVAQFGDGSWSVAWRSEMPEENRDHFENGTDTYYCLELMGANGDPVSPDVAEVFAKEVGVHFVNPYSQSTEKGATFKLG